MKENVTSQEVLKTPENDGNKNAALCEKTVPKDNFLETMDTTLAKSTDFVQDKEVNCMFIMHCCLHYFYISHTVQ